LVQPIDCLLARLWRDRLHQRILRQSRKIREGPAGPRGLGR